MTHWFESFNQMLKGQKVDLGLGLIPAANADMDVVVRHILYQFKSKTKEAVEETFPETIEKMSLEKWESVWREFIESNSSSPRSLDNFPKVFLDYFQTTDAPHALKELMKFEWAIEIHPWVYERLEMVDLEGMELSDELVIEVAPLDIQTFNAPVLALYQGSEVFDDMAQQQVLFWFNQAGIQFYALDSWERNILENLKNGLTTALTFAPDDTQSVGAFFQWLGRSGLIRSYRLS